MSGILNKKGNHVYDVIVLGAGPAGIAALKGFKKSGFDNVVALEARNRIGGKAITDDVFGDLGPAWLHIPTQADLISENISPKEFLELKEDIESLGLLEFAKNHGFNFKPDDETITSFFNGTKISDQLFYDQIEKMKRRIGQKLKQLENPDINYNSANDVSVAWALRSFHRKNSGYDEGLIKFISETEFGGAEHGLELEKVSVRDLGDIFSRTSGILCTEGLGNLIHDYGKEIKDKVRLNKRVIAFSALPGKFNVSVIDEQTGEIEHYTAKKGIVTLPIGVLKCKDEKYKITHNLPRSKIEAISKINMGTFSKIILLFDDQFFKQNNIIENSQIHIHDDRVREDFAMIALPCGKPIVAAFIGGKASSELENRSESESIELVLNSLTTAFGNDVRSHFITGKRTEWNNDPFSRGAYSATEIGFSDARKELTRPYRDSLFFAGEACYTEGWQTHLLGALFSGDDVATEVMKKLTTEKSAYNR